MVRVSRIGIFSQLLFQETAVMISDILTLGESSNVSFFFNPELFDFLIKTNPNIVQGLHRESLEDMRVDCIISIGGDGTILRVARTRPDIPILSINKGRKGFMAEIEPKDVSSKFKQFLNGEFNLEEHRRIEALIDGKKIGSAINEIVITSVDLLKPIDFRIFVDKIGVSSSLADGVIIATAIGSTGHCLSSGGCVLDPILDNFEISWINPINLAIRPLILDSSRTIRIRCATRINPIKFVIDGQVTLEYDPPIEVIFRSSEQTVKFFRSRSFLARLRQHFNPEIRE
ncbi:MAG: NAD(+)/NADH kinase [Candidatus Heimdallarchaeota archaeon]|nr:MAG: NAD(+)/NADH kinase [Candidatus Heimdallarchaeota archaeon]